MLDRSKSERANLVERMLVVQFLAVGIFVIAMGSAWWHGVKDERKTLEERFSSQAICCAQLENLSARIRDVDERIEVSRQRKEWLEFSLMNRDLKQAYQVRAEWMVEKQALAQLLEEKKGHSIRSASETVIAFVLFWLVGMGMCHFLYRWLKVQYRILLRCRDSQNSYEEMLFGRAVRVYLYTEFGRILITSVARVDKAWFTFDSYCVDPNIFLFMRAANISSALIIACPITLGWIISQRDLRPIGKSEAVPGRSHAFVLDPRNAEGHCGVGDYLRIQERSLLLSGGVATMIVSVWLSVAREQMAADWAYVIHPIVGLTVTALFMRRFMQNLLAVRHLYWRELAALRNEEGGRMEWAEVKAQVAPDPTIPFLGDGTWVIFTRMAAFSAFLWGLGKVLLL